MKCAECQERLSMLLDGEMSQSDAVAVKAHISVCKDCERAYARMTALEDRLQGLPVPVVHPALASRVKAELFREERSLWESPPFHVWRKIPVLVMILALAVGLGNMAGRSMTSFLLDPRPDTRAEFLVSDTDNSLADAIFDISSEENSR
jgi:sigma-E factor negative regulatory protein RseA